MAAKKTKSSGFSEDLSMLDDLIKRCYQELLKSFKENVKLGDFIRMIEMRRKLAPSDTDQKKFWSMLEKIRQKTLGKAEGNTGKRTRKGGSK
jgi:hypothetical protein